METCGLPPGTKLFINENLSPIMRELSYNARLLVKDKRIESTWFSNASVRLKMLDGSVAKVFHETDLYARFPDFNNSTFDTNFCNRVIEDDRDAYDDLAGMWDL